MPAEISRPLKRHRPLSAYQDVTIVHEELFLQPQRDHLRLKHYEDFWFEDGNVVLVAQDVAFRIYLGLLAAQSTVFADMLSVSRPGADETYEGCPVVRLTDSPHDFAHLLSVLMPKDGQMSVFISFLCVITITVLHP